MAVRPFLRVFVLPGVMGTKNDAALKGRRRLLV